MVRFETIPAKRSDCSKIACLARGDQFEAIVKIGLDPFRELVQAYDETPNPMAWLIDGELAALGGIAGPPGLCPIGIAWLVVAEHATRFSYALAREVRRQISTALEAYPLVVSPLIPNDTKALRFAEVVGFAIKLAYQQDELLFAVYGKQQKSSVKLQEAA
jgi:hypothetical protein